MVDLLLECGAEVNPPDLLGPSPLLAAVKSHQVGILKKLIDAGARLNYSAPHLKLYRSPLFVACVERCPEVISVTLDSGGDPSWADPAWYTPTLLAYQLNSDWLPRFLDAGAGSTFRQRWVLTDVLTCGILKGDLTCVTLLVARYPDLVFLPHKLWSLPLIQAARLGKLSILRFLLENGAPVDALAGHLGEAALHAAASEGYVECVEALLRAGADVDRKRRDGLTALHIACLEDRKQLAELLLDFGADANTYDLNSGETPLISTILARNEAMGLILLKKKEKGKLDPNMQDSGGRSALSFALYFGMLKCAQQLLVEGADVTLKDETGATPHDIMLDRLRKQGIQRRLCGTIERLKRNRDREIGQDKASQMRKEREKKRSGIRRETSGDLSSSDFTPMAPRGQWGSGCPCPLSIFSCSNGNGNVGGVQSRSGKQKDANSRPEGGRMFEEGARGGAVVFSESAGVGMDFRSSDFHSFRFQRETGGTPDGGTTA
uniref:Uncharacterized protein n=1 Tax=Chromera velia CCMP2878 TaxID=1169474 RepID=A0A0G4HY83_9ALVE|eukprot:Cvel_9445.t1-p1 / transcript=Cvel_9445.t1 / gene=Cvel_9445 / organism=Chromera_velia_CCMP2878 / gene_product=Serine/threonine-protein phosphatase 6 regulatory, putative / transcript_product=Serine/threonine-protein phosphatase 6 regulatory, putative / location=Cvel_scaffold544:75362-80260(-) / protein_length=490 / sequence_SO=supercontig / SO=protein_coding / is_pseudo=false